MIVSKSTLESWILECLERQGGSGGPESVGKYIWENYEAELRKSDIFYTWQYDLRWAAQKLRDSGVLKKVNNRKTLPWELSKK
ncbi:hypothetical protein HRJ45_24250 [Vibrio coralliilyticus]|uniref:hypothetical protein n=1 Tax=Vibrio coralliilyticus TaxID=190893 RepID=UPI0015608E70|nr:hypothetical protein [Vibrio coralliilyticus]NRF28101.1 hypothetical protein [Vibrio coralliilyticus]NRF82225.1 hypothetical protein [Vibrio coralliilyticus]